jgi:hypothetical protein
MAESDHFSRKVRPYHLERKAVLYVRQSSAHQVLLPHRESLPLDRAGRERAAGTSTGLMGLPERAGGHAAWPAFASEGES